MQGLARLPHVADENHCCVYGLINLVSVPADDARQVTLAMRGGGTSGAQTPDLAVDSLKKSINQFTFTVFGSID